MTNIKPTQEIEIIAPCMDSSLGSTQTCGAFNNSSNIDLILSGTPKEIANKLNCCQQTAASIQERLNLLVFLKESICLFSPLIHDHYSTLAKSRSTSENPRNAGRKNIDPVSMFFLLCLADHLRLSDEAFIIELTCNSLLREVVGLDQIPSPKTMHHYRKIFHLYGHLICVQTILLYKNHNYPPVL